MLLFSQHAVTHMFSCARFAPFPAHERVLFCSPVSLTPVLQTYGSGNLKRVGVILQRGVLILLLACFPCWAVLINTQPILLAVRQSTEVARWSLSTSTSLHHRCRHQMLRKHLLPISYSVLFLHLIIIPPPFFLSAIKTLTAVCEDLYAGSASEFSFLRRFTKCFCFFVSASLYAALNACCVALLI